MFPTHAHSRFQTGSSTDRRTTRMVVSASSHPQHWTQSCVRIWRGSRRSGTKQELQPEADSFIRPRLYRAMSKHCLQSPALRTCPTVCCVWCYYISCTGQGILEHNGYELKVRQITTGFKGANICPQHFHSCVLSIGPILCFGFWLAVYMLTSTSQDCEAHLLPHAWLPSASLIVVKSPSTVHEGLPGKQRQTYGRFSCSNSKCFVHCAAGTTEV